MRDHPLVALVLVLAPISLLMVGGGGSLIAPLHDEVVDARGWLTAREFVEIYAIAQASPGPGSMVVALVGWKVAGWAGAVTAVLAIIVPSSVLYCLASRVWDRYRGTAIHSALESGLAPVGTGLMFAGAAALLRAADAGLAGWAVAAVATGVMLWRNLHPLLIIFAAGALFGALRLA